MDTHGQTTDKLKSYVERLERLLDEVDGSRYALVLIAAKRARQINNYHHQLGEGTFEEVPPMVESRSKNYLTMALMKVEMISSILVKKEILFYLKLDQERFLVLINHSY